MSLFHFLWKTKALPSVQFIVWRALINSIASKDNLGRRGVAVVSNLCFFCRVEVETTGQLFFECRIAWVVWNHCYIWLGLGSVDHHDYVSHFLHFKLLNVPINVNVVWGSVWIAVVGEIWKHRNKHIFKGEWLIIPKVHLGLTKGMVLGYI